MKREKENQETNQTDQKAIQCVSQQRKAELFDGKEIMQELNQPTDLLIPCFPMSSETELCNFRQHIFSGNIHIIVN